MPSLVDSMRLKADQAALEADKLIRIRREQGAIDQLHRDIKAQLDALSQAAFTAYRAGEISHPQLLNICRQMDSLNEQIGQRQARIEQIRAEKLATPPFVPAAQTGLPCPNCKQLIPSGAAFCPVCGYKIPKLAPAESTCLSCGNPMLPGAQFCPNCGARKTQTPQTIRCTGCGAELPATAIFCPDCGTRVGQGATSGSALATGITTPPVAAPPPAFVAPIVPQIDVVAQRGEGAPQPEPEAALAPDAPAVLATTVVSEATPEPLTKLCPSCHAELLMEAIFCPDCGARQQMS